MKRLRIKLDEYGLITCDEFSLDCFKGGGKGGGGGGGTTTVTQPIVVPTPQVQDDASVEQSTEQEELKKKAKEGKGSLKIPLATDVGTGLKV